MTQRSKILKIMEKRKTNTYIILELFNDFIVEYLDTKEYIQQNLQESVKEKEHQ